jgi:hypothetical protein
MTESEIEMVSRHIARCGELIARQRRLLERYPRGLSDWHNARELLDQLEMAQTLHRAHLAEILRRAS